MRDATFDMTVGSPTKGIVRFALPLVMGYILQQMYLVADAAIVGRWVGVNALAAVGASSSVMFLVLGFCNGVCAGFSIPVAQAFGGKQERLMRSFVANALRLALMLSLGITIAACLSCGVILRILNTPVEIFHDAAVFLLLQFLAIPFVMAYNLFACLIRALGNSRKPFHFLVVASLLNIVLDIVFIVVCRMGVVGAGVATCLAQAFAAWLCWRYIRSEMRVLVPQGSERRCNTHLMHQLCGGLHGFDAREIPFHVRFREHWRSNGHLLRAKRGRWPLRPSGCGSALCVIGDASLLRLHFRRHLAFCRRHDATLRASGRRRCTSDGDCWESGLVHARGMLFLSRVRRTDDIALQHPGNGVCPALGILGSDGDAGSLWGEPMACSSIRILGRLLWRPCSLALSRRVPHPRLFVGVFKEKVMNNVIMASGRYLPI